MAIKRFIAACLLGVLSLVQVAIASELTLENSTLYQYKILGEIQEDFVSGTNSSSQVGWLGWGVGSGTPAQIASEANRPGIFNLTTGAVSGTNARIFLRVNTELIFVGNTFLDVLWVNRLNMNDANTTARFGMWRDTAAVNNGMYFEKLDADTNWQCEIMEASAPTRADSGVAVDTSFHDFRIVRQGNTLTQFFIDGVKVCTITATFTANAISPLAAIINSAAANKTMSLDYFQLRYGVSR